MTDALVLPSVLDLKAAGPLRSAILERRGQPLCLDASAVQRLGGLCLQVLISAARTWEDDERSFEITARSEAFAEALGLFGAGGRVGDDNILGVG